MKLESLKNGIFAESTLKEEQLFALNGGRNCKTGPGRIELTHSGKPCVVDYGYDRTDGETGITTYHDRKIAYYIN
jgi:hypothetical protein